MSTIAVITVATGTHALSDQAAALAQGDTVPDLLVVVALPDGEERMLQADLDGPWRTIRTVATPGEADQPTAFAHNVGAAEAIAQHVDLLVFLDDDVLPDPGLVSSFVGAIPAGETRDLARMSPERLAELLGEVTPTLWGGQVADLPEVDSEDDYDLSQLGKGAEIDANGARVKDGAVQEAVDITRFDSANVAVRAEDFLRCGGFPTTQVVGEDTALTQVVQRLGGSLCWVGGAVGYRKHHPGPSVAHAAGRPATQAPRS